MNETVTVRVQKVRKNRIRVRLTLFLILAAALLLVAIFADKIVPYDPYAQDLSKSLLPLVCAPTTTRENMSRP